MSIIERAAELLGSAPQRQRTPPAPSIGVGNREEDLIERAVGEFGRLRDGSGSKDLARQSSQRPGSGSLAGKPVRTQTVDRDRLRRRSMLTPDCERTQLAESFRRVKRKILANIAGAKDATTPANLVMVTSALPGEGKTFCAVNLAISIALEVDRSVLLVDTDVAKSDVPKALGLEAGKGLMDVLLDQRTDLAEVLWKTDIGSLSVLPVGTAHKHATELLASEAMRALLHEISERYHDRIIIFDSPPLLAASEAGVLAGQMGQIVLVVEAAKTTETAVKDALARVDSSKVTGVLLNKGQDVSLEYGYDGYG